MADIWYKGTTHNLAWDPVTTYEDGSPIAGGETVTYNLYLKNEQTGVATSMGSTAANTAQIILPQKGRYYFGLQAAIDADVSAIMWSDNAIACQDEQTFGMRWMPPQWPGNIRHQ